MLAIKIVGTLDVLAPPGDLHVSAFPPSSDARHLSVTHVPPAARPRTTLMQNGWGWWPVRVPRSVHGNGLARMRTWQ